MTAKRLSAPEFPDHVEWFNVESPIRLSEQQNRVVLLNFSTYCPLQCTQTLEVLQYLENKYHDGVVVIGIHGPRFPSEKTSDHLQKAINRSQVRHPVINDDELHLWRTYGIRTSPTIVVIDPRGVIVGAVSGENKRYKLDRVTGYLLSRMKTSSTARTSAYTLRTVPEQAHTLSFPGRILATRNRVFIADSGHNRILETTLQGHVIRHYGNNTPGFIDGNGPTAAFDNPQGMVIDGDYLYVADTGNHAIRRIHLHSDDVVTIAGTGRPGGLPDGDYFNNPLEVNLNAPCGLALVANVVYIAMAGFNQIWSLSLVTNTLEVFAGSGEKGLRDGASRIASFAQPSALTILGNTLYAVDPESSAIRTVDLATRSVTTIAGQGPFEYGDCDGPACDARFQYPLDINADQRGRSLWVADTYNNKIKKIEINNNIVSSMQVGCRLNEPGGLAFSDNTLYIANTNLHEIVRINLQSGTPELLHVSDQDTGL
jgi:DNA-binding beta-propeller fold protein YncE